MALPHPRWKQSSETPIRPDPGTWITTSQHCSAASSAFHTSINGAILSGWQAANIVLLFKNRGRRARVINQSVDPGSYRPIRLGKVGLSRGIRRGEDSGLH